MATSFAWALVLALGPTVASAQCYEDNRCFYTCGYGYYQHAGLALLEAALYGYGPGQSPAAASEGHSTCALHQSS